jgi:hypothetical protein
MSIENGFAPMMGGDVFETDLFQQKTVTRPGALEWAINSYLA